MTNDPEPDLDESIDARLAGIAEMLQKSRDRPISDRERGAKSCQVVGDSEKRLKGLLNSLARKEKDQPTEP